MAGMRHRHSRPAFVVLLLLLSGCAAHKVTPRDAPPLSLTPWAELSVRPGLARRIMETTVQVGDMQYAGAGDGLDHWLRKTTRFFGGATRVQWTDTGSCAAARAVLSNMYALETPRPTEGGVIEVRADGVLYVLSVDGRYASGRLARLSFSSSGGTPLSNWAERSLVDLEVCWSDLQPPNIR
jgi:hypothetical protein